MTQRGEVRIEDHAGTNTADLNAAAVELVEGLLQRKCKSLNLRLGENTATVSFNLEDVPGLEREELREIISDFDGDDIMTCSIDIVERDDTPDATEPVRERVVQIRPAGSPSLFKRFVSLFRFS